ncbi:protein-export membrane protein SecF [Campylobacter pinnipediorum subsp. caledonicus]|uniref:Protein-export membrane protein SecF n=1 Tax=Campylobacter pinnipediorum subsp. caledonicus TaxID=1874362 RepID=A0A1S6U9X7_9BACT|nr:protein translocase subunit SecF [Campylobacter pinnipediorum]AQW86845.1 protein-export membrane protein SecF [Campylobacter pinnipediorum subsp. caledonicus]AQW88500.1 protein-export membrane protein SecF [Campylobacter pinnipediorum subsp. caledonicus]OPA71049.1 protein-export membrane protein SecF [Campylobacter pinnipediorum subsp. caledonicus]
MQIFTKAKVYDFMKFKIPSTILSAILFFGSVFLLTTKGLNYGIDFAGGTLIQLKYDKEVSLDKVREALAVNETLRNASVTKFGNEKDTHEIIVRFLGSSSDVGSDAGDTVKQLLKDTGNVEVRRVDMVGPKVGGELRSKALMAIFISFGAVLIYIALRFEWRFAIAAIISEIHDIIITMGAISLFAIDVNLDTLAAILTVLGYSLNDTIIIFDRIREGITTSKRDDIAGIINESVSSTLSRTILTSSSTFIVVFVLYNFGGDMISGFSFVLMVGVLVGTLSSVYIASAFLIWLKFSVEQYRNRLNEKLKQKRERERERAKFEKGVV